MKTSLTQTTPVQNTNNSQSSKKYSQTGSSQSNKIPQVYIQSF